VARGLVVVGMEGWCPWAVTSQDQHRDDRT
jgi:hypothetical protein